MVDYHLLEKHKIWLDDVSNQDIGLVLQGPFRLSAPVPKVTKISIPGRNGDLHYYDGSYENRVGEVGCYLYRDSDVKKAFGEVHNWLFSNLGYRRLETSDDADHFMLARPINGADMMPRINRLSPFDLSFDCKPQRFLKIGEEPVIFTKPADVSEVTVTIENPTVFTSKPLYKLTGSGEGRFLIGVHGVMIVDMDGDIYFDAETESAYRGSENMNSKFMFTVSDSLEIQGGKQEITIGGGITQVEIIPRWWEL